MTDLERVTNSLELTIAAMVPLCGEFKDPFVNGYIEAAYNRLHRAELDLLAARVKAVINEREAQEPTP